MMAEKKDFKAADRFLQDETAIARSSDSLHFGPVLDAMAAEQERLGRPVAVLDLGSAACALRGMLRCCNIPSNYTALDREARFLSQGRKEYGVKRLVQGDMYALPFVPKSFDVVVATGILLWVDMRDIPDMLRSLMDLAGSMLLLNFLAPPLDTNSVRLKGASRRTRFVTLLQPGHFLALLEEGNIPMPSYSLGWSAPLNVDSDFPTYRGLPYRRECLYIWKMGEGI